MLIKSADDKTMDINILQGLLNHPAATADVKRRIDQEIRTIRSGVKGENDAAHEMKFYFDRSQNWAVIHDLRIEHDERVAQIDHLLVNRWLDVWVCESKRFGEGIAINDHGECSAFFGGKPYGVPSPFEQNRKHCAVLKAVCDDGAVELPKRLGLFIKPNISSLVLVSKNARIKRTKAKVEGLDSILKVDQLREHINKVADSDYNILSAAKIIGSDTLEDFASRLAALHKPIAFDWHARFGLPREVISPPPARPVQGASETDPPVSEKQNDGRKKSRPICFSCKKLMPENEAEYCRSHKAKFGGKLYCWDCQKSVPATV